MKVLKYAYFMVLLIGLNVLKAETLEPKNISSAVEDKLENSKDIKALENYLKKSEDELFKAEIEKRKKDYISKHRRELESYIENGKNVIPLIYSILIKHNLPPELLAVPIIESNYKIMAKSPKGAAGLWQLMPETARNFGLKVSEEVDERLDPIKSTLAAVKYFKKLYSVFGDWQLVLASYNAGHNKVITKVSYHGNSFSSIKNFLPKQTKEYVLNFIAIAQATTEIIKKKGLDKEDVNFDIVKVNKGYTFEEISKLTYIKRETLDKLNPHLLKKRIPNDGEEYNLYVPKGYGKLVKALLDDSV
ncbi:membrane-bound lytic murein transglycosylase D [Sulfurihydrogenibium yellowstonense SS-5]|uniref:Membrane-bound lytic murein transglycosylase D n=2 Tax=Sulfurihydrogenibium yellowstonense TaxID=304736 RepID=C4FJ10_9AQUI|nr:membrane-bound lytic murein transglycosylase D [Sulfurihydrogenibium yellowstonense SS-5]